MLQVNFIRNNKERVIEGLKKRNFSAEDLRLVDDVLQLDDTRRTTQVELDTILAERNTLSKEIGDLMKQGKRAEAEQQKERVTLLKEQATVFENRTSAAQSQLETILYRIPNIPHTSVPFGKTPEENEVYKAWEKPLPDLGANALPHWELSAKYTVFDLELGTKLTGAGFPVYRGKGAKLQRALISFFLDAATNAGYEEIQPPLMVNEDSARGTGQLPDKEAQMYYVNVIIYI